MKDTSAVSRFTGEYAHDFEIWSECYESSHEISLLREQFVRETNLLNAGCGTGRLAFPLASYIHSVTGVDTRSELIALCRDRRSNDTHSRLCFEETGTTELEYIDGEFDVVLDTGLFSMAEDPAPLADEYGRVVANGGLIITIVKRSGSEYDELLRQAGSQYGHNGEHVENELREQFGDPLITKDIVAPHRYRSVKEAHDALEFCFEERMGVSLSEKQRERVREQIKKHEWESDVRIHEYARVHVFQNSAFEQIRDEADDVSEWRT